MRNINFARLSGILALCSIACAFASCDAFDSWDDLSVSGASGTVDGCQYVDMGLSVKWARYNVGASKPEGFGSYFAWGETSEKSVYSEDNSETTGVALESIGGTSYDAATVNWGSDWRLPTVDEFQELIDNCSLKWVELDEDNEGYVFTSNVNGNSIYLPAAGGWSDSVELVGNGYYWSADCSTKGDTYYTRAAALDFIEDEEDWFTNAVRYRGFAVRAVTE